MTSEALAGGRHRWLTGAPIGLLVGAIRMGGRHGLEHYRTTFFWSFVDMAGNIYGRSPLRI